MLTSLIKINTHKTKNQTEPTDITINEDGLVHCDKCGTWVEPTDFFAKSSNSRYWSKIIGDEFNCVCIPCADHRFCYPYFDLRFYDNLNPNHRLELEKASHLCTTDFYYERHPEPVY